MSTTRPPGFEEFVDAHSSDLWRLAWLLTGHRQDAEDLLQETLVRVATAWNRIDHDRQPLAFARTVMTRRNISRWRATRRRVQLVLGDAAAAGDAPETAPSAQSRLEDAEEVRELLSPLNARERSVLVLTYLADLPDEAIAEILRIAPVSVRSLRSRSLARARELHRADDPLLTDRRSR